jgi:hypothetical protein
MVEIWTQTVNEREEAYRVATEESGSDRFCFGRCKLGELVELEKAQERLLHWQNKLAEMDGTVPQVHQMAQAQTMAVPTQIMATPPQPQLMAPALQSQMQARPGCA